MARLDTERQKENEPKRMLFCKEELQKRGHVVNVVSNNCIEFEYKGAVVKLFPYSGWFTGKTVTDGRGITNLLKQLDATI
jgi:hypothetical protein